MKKNKIINIGEDFKEKNSIIEGYKSGYFKDFKTLEECYNNCSSTKKSIYNYYYNLLLENADSVENYGVRSFNSMIIVLQAIIKKDGKTLYLLITPSYNYYTEIEEGEKK